MKKIILCALFLASALFLTIPVILRAAPDATPAPEAPAVTKLSVFSLNIGGEDIPAFDEIISDYSRGGGKISIEYDAADSQSEYSSLLRKKTADSRLSDIFAFARGVSLDAAEDLTVRRFTAGLPYDVRRLVSRGGRTYAFPLELASAGLFVNMSILREHGIESPPKNYRQFVACCSRLAYDGLTPIAADSDVILPSQAAVVAARSLAPLYAKGRSTFRLYSEGAKSMGELLRPGLAALREFSEQRFWNARSVLASTSCASTISRFADGTVPFAIGATWQIPSLVENEPHFDFLFIPLPLADNNSVVLLRPSCALSVNAEGKSKKEALDFLDFISDPKRAKKYAEKRTSLDPYEKENSSAPLLKNVTDAMKNGAVVCCDTGDDFAFDLAPIIERAADIVMRGGTVDEAAAAADEMQRGLIRRK